MHEQEIRTYAGLMEEFQLTGLEVEADGVRVRLERLHAPATPVMVSQTPVSTAAPAAAKAEVDGDMVEVTSPMGGVFYSAPTERAGPFARAGSKVKKGDVLCIIEAMKLMNEITAECDGTIVDIGAGNNQVVDYGHVLFRIRKERP